ncbi:anti-restriction nuclease [Escherichia phage A7_1]|nr:anti-restriction nuclease [Escherichia phage A7_1]
MDIKQITIEALQLKIKQIEHLNQMMNQGWGTYTNQPAWEAMDHPYLVNLCKGDRLAIIRDGLKPFLRDMHIKMNEEIIDSLYYQIRKLENENN